MTEEKTATQIISDILENVDPNFGVWLAKRFHKITGDYNDWAGKGELSEGELEKASEQLEELLELLVLSISNKEWDEATTYKIEIPLPKRFVNTLDRFKKDMGKPLHEVIVQYIMGLMFRGIAMTSQTYQDKYGVERNEKKKGQFGETN